MSSFVMTCRLVKSWWMIVQIVIFESECHFKIFLISRLQIHKMAHYVYCSFSLIIDRNRVEYPKRSQFNWLTIAFYIQSPNRIVDYVLSLPWTNIKIWLTPTTLSINQVLLHFALLVIVRNEANSFLKWEIHFPHFHALVRWITDKFLQFYLPQINYNVSNIVLHPSRHIHSITKDEHFSRKTFSILTDHFQCIL
jgi:hypothetical protein